jgi:hypothetical protein
LAHLPAGSNVTSDFFPSFWPSISISEHLSNPDGPSRLNHSSFHASLQTWAHAKGKKLPDNLALGAHRHGLPRSTTPGILHGEMEWSGAGFILDRWVAAGSKKTSHRPGAASPDGAV